MKKYITMILFALMLTCTVGTMSVSARDPIYSPLPVPPPETEPPVVPPSPQTGDARTNPIVPITGSVAFAGIAVCAGVSSRKRKDEGVE